MTKIKKTFTGKRNELIKAYVNELRYRSGYRYRQLAKAMDISTVTMCKRVHELYSLEDEKLAVMADMLSVDVNDFKAKLLELKAQNELATTEIPD